MRSPEPVVEVPSFAETATKESNYYATLLERYKDGMTPHPKRLDYRKAIIYP